MTNVGNNGALGPTQSPAARDSKAPAETPPGAPIAKTPPLATAGAGSAPPVPPPASLPPEPHALSHLSTPYQAVDFALRGVHFEGVVESAGVVDAALELDREGFALDTITGVDWMTQGQMEVVYDFFHPTKPHRVAFRTRVARDHAEVPTIQHVFPGANWHERETHDFFGIRFAGHPDLTPFLLPEDADYHPLRKDFVA